MAKDKSKLENFFYITFATIVILIIVLSRDYLLVNSGLDKEPHNSRLNFILCLASAVWVLEFLRLKEDSEFEIVNTRKGNKERIAQKRKENYDKKEKAPLGSQKRSYFHKYNGVGEKRSFPRY